MCPREKRDQPTLLDPPENDLSNRLSRHTHTHCDSHLRGVPGADSHPYRKVEPEQGGPVLWYYYGGESRGPYHLTLVQNRSHDVYYEFGQIVFLVKGRSVTGTINICRKKEMGGVVDYPNVTYST